jgi:hypothetical protein
MVFDAHDRAFGSFKGACRRRIYDNIKTAVETIFVGRERAIIGAFCKCVVAKACTEEGQVENQVGLCGSASLPHGCG